MSTQSHETTGGQLYHEPKADLYNFPQQPIPPTADFPTLRRITQNRSTCKKYNCAAYE